MAPVVSAFPRDADFLSAGEDGEVGVIVLLLVVVALEGDAGLDGEGVEFAREAGFRRGEAADDECLFTHNFLLFDW